MKEAEGCENARVRSTVGNGWVTGEDVREDTGPNIYLTITVVKASNPQISTTSAF